MLHFGALEAGGTKMVCAVGNAQGQILERISLPTRDPENTMPEILAFFREKQVSAVGVGCFGPVDLDRNSPTYGNITSSPKLQWRNFPMLRRFREALGVPVGFDTDVNAAALGEAVWGCTKSVKNSIYITVGTGVGVGVIIGGKPYHGMIHPEGGHIFVHRRPDDPMAKGICPYHGNCLEAWPAARPLSGAGAGRGRSCRTAWQSGSWRRSTSDRPCTYICTLSPERIVVGGGVMHQEQMLPMIRQEVRRQMHGYIQGKGMDKLEEYIVPVSLGDNQGVMGGVKLAMDAYIEEGGTL